MNLAAPSGVAYVVSLLVLAFQMTCINAFLVIYLSKLSLLVLVVEVPLFVHIAWHWKEESALRSAPREWLGYSWVHAAKVVVLFCRVMPLLPSTEDNATSKFHFLGIDWTHLFTPTILANLLLITPVFYALLMFRTSKAIFGKSTHRITVDLILHYDMLWHVVIDMVDQVDMFHYARLPEWETETTFGELKDTIIRIQTVIALFLFLSMVLQAQAFPGVAKDQWKLPEPPELNSQREEQQPPQQEQQASRARAESPLRGLAQPEPLMLPPAAIVRDGSASSFSGRVAVTAAREGRQRPGLATLRERSTSGQELPSPEAARSQASSSTAPAPQEPTPSSQAPPPPPEPACLRPVNGLPGLQLPLPPAQGQRPPGSFMPLSPNLPPHLSFSPPLGDVAGRESTDDSPPLPKSQPLRNRFTTSSLSRRSCASEPMSSMRPSLRSTPARVTTPVWMSIAARESTRSSRDGSEIAGGEVMSRDRFLRMEKDRRRRLQDIMSSIHRQNIIVARKRSAMISIFFTDIPFLTIRLWLWINLGSRYFPGLGVKNAICIILNGMQATLVRFADRAAFRDIQQQLVQYRMRFVDAVHAAQASNGTPEVSQPSPGVPSLTMPLSPPEPTTSPPLLPADDGREGRGRATAAAQLNWRRSYADAERATVRETVRRTGVCVHFWCLLVAFALGFSLTKGERVFVTLWTLVSPFSESDGVASTPAVP